METLLASILCFTLILCIFVFMSAIYWRSKYQALLLNHREYCNKYPAWRFALMERRLGNKAHVNVARLLVTAGGEHD